jgi:hypothetical protein
VFGFPDRLLTKLRYCDTGVVSGATGSVGQQVFRLNSTFDPDFTNVGHQPMFRDTYASVYDQYSVVSVVAKIQLININTSDIIITGAVIDDDTTASTSAAVLMEQSHGVNRDLTPLAGSRSEWEFTINWSAKEFLNIDPFSSQTYKTSVGSNPTEVSTLALWAAAENGSSSIFMHWKIELDMTVLWTELTTPSLS